MGSGLAVAAVGVAVVAPPAPAPIDSTLGSADWSVWRPENQHHALELDAGPLYWRRVGSADRASTGGFEVGAGAATTVRIAPLVLSSTRGIVLREFDSASYALSYVQSLSAGLVLGPLEPEVRVALSMATIDAFHGNWSAELFVPRTAAGAWLRAGPLRFGAHAFSEYLWRWFGNGDVFVRGVSFSLEIGR